MERRISEQLDLVQFILTYMGMDNRGSCAVKQSMILLFLYFPRADSCSVRGKTLYMKLSANHLHLHAGLQQDKIPAFS